MDAGTPQPSRRSMLAALPLLLAVAASVVLLLLPASTEEQVTVGAGGEVQRQTRSLTLVESEGWGVLAYLAIPVVLTGVPLIVGRPRRRTAFVAGAAVLWVLVGLSLASIGLFYVPTAIAMAVAASREWRGSRAPGGMASP